MASREPSRQRSHSRHASRDPYQTRSRTQSAQPSPLVPTVTLPGSHPEFTQSITEETHTTEEASPTVRPAQTQTENREDNEPLATSGDVFHLLSVVEKNSQLILELINTLEKGVHDRLTTIEGNIVLLRSEIGTRTGPTDGTAHQKLGYLNDKMIKLEAEIERNLNERETDYNARLESIRTHIDNQRVAIEKRVQTASKGLDDAQILRHREAIKKSDDIEKELRVIQFSITELEDRAPSERTESGQRSLDHQPSSTPLGKPHAWFEETEHTSTAVPRHLADPTPSTIPPYARTAPTQIDRRESSREQLFNENERGRSRERHERRTPRPSIGNTTLGISDKELSKAIMKKPDAYDGKRGLSARTFMTQMETYFLTRTVAMGEIEKIYAVLTNMGNNANAASWTQPLLEQRNKGVEHPYLQSWDAFRTAFLLNFDDPAFQLKASDELMAITQTSSVAEYASRFRALSAQVEWNDSTLTAGFKRGLKPHIRAELTKATLFDDRTRTFEEWATVAIKLDNVLYTRTNRPDRPVSQATTPTDARPRGVFVPEEQKELRIKEGRCIKCGKTGHQARECRGRWTLEANIPGGIKAKAGEILETAERTESGKD